MTLEEIRAEAIKLPPAAKVELARALQEDPEVRRELDHERTAGLIATFVENPWKTRKLLPGYQMFLESGAYDPKPGRDLTDLISDDRDGR